MSTDRRTRPDEHNPSGIYLGMVVNHLDSKYTGTLEVELLKNTESGNLTRRTGNIIQAKYMSPFYGTTPYRDMSRNTGWDNTQKSYGWWAIPPDPGTVVLVLFAENNFGQAYWIGCVQDEFMNFMVPGYAGTTYNDFDVTKPLPVGEYNKKLETGAGRDPTKFIKPHNPFAYDQLDKSGLLTDHIRGTNTSSARREVPSMVFGVSTPGPQDRNGPTMEYGPQGGRINAPFSRLGGSSFVMDDGDMSLQRITPPSGELGDQMQYASVEAGETNGDPTRPANELIRLKTRSGHQILLHNTEDLIYISHGSGNSWIEMTGNGKIDIYAKDSISVHSDNDINFHANRDINLRAKNNINMTADNDIFQTAGNDWAVYAGQDGKLTALRNTNIKAGLDHRETARTGKIYMNSDVEADQAPKASVPTRVPRHEPWPDHEHLNPKAHLPQLNGALDLSNPALQDPDISANTASDTFVFPPIPDTFKKPST